MLGGRRIGIDVRALAPPLTGTGIYLRELLDRFAELAPSAELHCYANKPAALDRLPPGPFRPHLASGLSSRWGSVWLQTGAKRAILGDRVELFWGPLQVAPLSLIGELPIVVTLHDLVFDLYPETMSWRNRLLLRRLAVPSLHRADRVISVSAATRDAAIERLGVAAEKIRVVHSGVAERFAPMPADQARARVAELIGEHGEFLLFVGTLEPRKNLVGLLDALEVVAAQTDFDSGIVLAGARGWGGGELRERLSTHPLRQRFRLTGYIEDDDLPALYSAARMLVMPSLYEGFGLPVLEAMRCGTPVLCSSVDPFPEIAGDAAELAPTDDASRFAEALLRVWNDEERRQELRARGLRRAAEFSWHESARQTLSCFEELLA